MKFCEISPQLRSAFKRAHGRRRRGIQEAIGDSRLPDSRSLAGIPLSSFPAAVKSR